MKDRKSEMKFSFLIVVIVVIDLFRCAVVNMITNLWITPYECYANAKNMALGCTWTHTKTLYANLPCPSFQQCLTHFFFFLSGPASPAAQAHLSGPSQHAE